MKAEILCVGTELLLGDCVNTNAAHISRELKNLGIDLYYHTVVGDNPKRLKEMLQLCFSRSDIIILTGGLGPTYDDLTKETVAEYFNAKLIQHQESFEKLKSFFARLNREMTENNIKQALIPEGGIALANEIGTAPGVAITKDGKTAVMLPGPPREMIPMFEKQVIPFLQKLSGHVFVSDKLNIFGIGESNVEEMLLDLMKDATNPTVAPYVCEGEMYVRVTACGSSEREAEAIVAPVTEEIEKRLAGYIYAKNYPNLQTYCVQRLKETNKTVAVAESCTGGLLAKKLTEIPGASQVFGYGVCTYSNEAKQKLLGVFEQTLNTFGAVSHETAKEMAKGIYSLSGADIGLSITGIAGPDGATKDKDVGLTYIGLCTKDGCESYEFFLGARNRDREMIRLWASVNALFLILKAVDGK